MTDQSIFVLKTEQAVFFIGSVAGILRNTNRMKSLIGHLAVVLGTFCLAASLRASIVTFTEVTLPGLCPNPVVVAGTCITSSTAITTYDSSMLAFSTTGATMGGLKVTAVFADGFRQTLIWDSATTGVANNSGTHQWSLSEPGDSYFTPFALANGAASTSAITDIILSGVGARNSSGNGIVFDRTSFPDITADEQTPGSNRGQDLNITAGNNGNTYAVLVTYSDMFRITSSNLCNNSGTGSGNQLTVGPCGDTWATLTLHFITSGAGAGTPFSPGSTMSFRQDTDNTVGAVQAPEPPTVGLLGAGLLAGNFLLRRLRRNRAQAAGASCR